MLRPTPGLPKPRGQRAKVMTQLGERREQEPQWIRTSVHKPDIQEKGRGYHESRLLFFQVPFPLGGPRQNLTPPGHVYLGYLQSRGIQDGPRILHLIQSPNCLPGCTCQIQGSAAASHPSQALGKTAASGPWTLCPEC